MKNSTLFISITCLIPALLISCIVNLKAQTELIGYTHLVTEYDHYYYVSNCEATWEEANEAATEMGGYLATLDWATEPLLNLLSPWAYGSSSFWIGLRGENGIYEWANGEPVTFESWRYQEPIYADGAARIEPIWFYYNYDSPTWASYPITDEVRYLVEFTFPPNCSNNPNKTYVCHNGNTICVNTSALQSHLNHGDLEGPCGPCNSYAMQILPDETSAIDGHSLQSVNTVLTEQKVELGVIQRIPSSNQINIYPNPASEEIHIVLPEVNQEGTLRILSLTGQEMRTIPLTGQQTITIDLFTYTAGIYLIDVRSADGHYQKKIVKL